ncbi:DUF2336 domain-containing protein [Xanthobacteraceae bacterium Astr-EGSB]|uniref:DUF2336 domain-containing protein n=1 Tax=Astrobacterium formosum TaxID=3069710 RepID=UPI0027B14002|nr:DUF2336 domain-containing protein [Xanthobacteraceae bacterium Astr-EGSB]
MATTVSLIHELEDALASGSSSQRIVTLGRVTDLFVNGADSYSEEQIDLFDDVLLKITARIEAKSLARLSSRIAPLANAPRRVVRELAFHDDISVASPVLRGSERISEADLLANARSKSQQHLLAISQRMSLPETVTDVLVERGDRDVVQSIVRNTGARFSDNGFRTLVSRSSADEALATQIGARRDIPRHHFLQLIERASARVRQKLIAANPLAATAVKDVVAEVEGGLRSEIRNASADYAAAKAQVEELYFGRRLDETMVYQFARSRQFEHTVVALSLLCGTEVDVVERALLDSGGEVTLILAKFAGLSWTTTSAILLLQAAERGISAQDYEQLMTSFMRLQPETAQRVLGFYRTRRKTQGEYPAR